jgi:hypothetical protein
MKLKELAAVVAESVLAVFASEDYQGDPKEVARRMRLHGTQEFMGLQHHAVYILCKLRDLGILRSTGEGGECQMDEAKARKILKMDEERRSL